MNKLPVEIAESDFETYILPNLSQLKSEVSRSKKWESLSSFITMTQT
jgi:hypothetical protein